MKTLLEWALLIESKFHNGRSMTCGHCGGIILGFNIVRNPKHMYPLGIEFECLDCRKCKVWTNSVRDLDSFIAFLKGDNKDYRRGFCNDDFCGYCFGYLQPLENGYKWKGKRWDRYGCTKCKQNQMVLVDGHVKNKENDTSWIISWYKKHFEELVAKTEKL